MRHSIKKVRELNAELINKLVNKPLSDKNVLFSEKLENDYIEYGLKVEISFNGVRMDFLKNTIYENGDIEADNLACKVINSKNNYENEVISFIDNNIDIFLS